MNGVLKKGSHISNVESTETLAGSMVLSSIRATTTDSGCGAGNQEERGNRSVKRVSENDFEGKLKGMKTFEETKVTSWRISLTNPGQ